MIEIIYWWRIDHDYIQRLQTWKENMCEQLLKVSYCLNNECQKQHNQVLPHKELKALICESHSTMLLICTASIDVVFILIERRRRNPIVLFVLMGCVFKGSISPRFNKQLLRWQIYDDLTGRSQFHQHFTRSFCANFLAPKKFKPTMKVQKSCSKVFCTKKLLVKCWWNWHQDGIECME